MAIRQRVTAQREQVLRDNRARHPMLKVGTRHFGLWETIVNVGNKKGGMTAAQMKSAYQLYHPQVLADLQKAKLVAKAGKIGSSYRYVADPNGKGIIPQQVEVTIELYETDTGAFVTRTELKGRRDDVGKIRKLLTTRTVKIDVPGEYAEGVLDVQCDIEPDPEPDVYELHRHRKAHRDANVIIDAEVHNYTPTRDGLVRLPSSHYNPEEDDGCIIDQ